MRPACALLALTVLALECAEGGERAQLLPPTIPRVRDALDWGWPGGSSSLCGPCVVSEQVRLEDRVRASFFAVPLPQTCSGGVTSASDPLGPGFAAWMCLLRGRPDLHGDLITRSHSWSLPKRFKCFPSLNRQQPGRLPPRFVRDPQVPEGLRLTRDPPSLHPPSGRPHPTPCPWRNPLLLLAACRGSESSAAPDAPGLRRCALAREPAWSSGAEDSGNHAVEASLGLF